MIYIHVPFCKSRCIYCDFYSTTESDEMRKAYVDALCKEIIARRDYLPSTQTETIYFGGGTPSLLSAQHLGQIMDCIRQNFTIAPDAELTIEANPDDVTHEWATERRSLGFNRVSLGTQSFDDSILSLLNRRHNAEAARQAVHVLHDEGIENISIDLIYGLPQQTPQMFAADLREAFALPIKHLSSYALSVEENTVLGQKVRKGELVPANEEDCLQEYNALIDAADLHGFEHYEISNFALPGFASRHNSAYWNGTPYLGVGPGAHSFDGKNRRYNLPNLRDYILKSGSPAYNKEILTREEQFDETVFTSLRTKQGLDLKKLRKLYGDDWTNELWLSAQRHLKAGTLEANADRLALTRQGVFTSDYVMSDLMRG